MNLGSTLSKDDQNEILKTLIDIYHIISKFEYFELSISTETLGKVDTIKRIRIQICKIIQIWIQNEEQTKEWILKKEFIKNLEKRSFTIISLLNDLLPTPIPFQISNLNSQQDFESFNLELPSSNEEEEEKKEFEKKFNFLRETWEEIIEINFNFIEENISKFLNSIEEFCFLLFKISNLSTDLSKKVLNLLLKTNKIVLNFNRFFFVVKRRRQKWQKEKQPINIIHQIGHLNKVL